MRVDLVRGAVVVAVGSVIGLAPPAAGDASGTYIPYGLTDRCVSDYFLYGTRGTTRYLCDEPLQADGSWERCRSFFSPEKYRAGSIDGQDGNPGGEGSLPELNIHECYTVTPDTVLPDEPDWIDPPTEGLIPLGSCLAQAFSVQPVMVCF